MRFTEAEAERFFLHLMLSGQAHHAEGHENTPDTWMDGLVAWYCFGYP